jgi:hypothetical protein
MSFLTKKSNISERLSGFSMEELPRTLKDAVRTARALGVDYLWIDAICIIQDDSEDWSKEASRMGKIYNHAYLTIAATNSESSFDGFLQDRELSSRASLGFTLKGVQPTRSPTAVNEKGIIHFRYPPETGVGDHLSRCAWNRRGWTLQENLLSTRTLYFTKEVVYYECAASHKVENPGYKLPAPQKISVFPTIPEDLPLTERMERREEQLSNWYRIVQQYAKRSLSCPSDKLPALEGLAASLSDLIQDVYIYGLWESDLHRGLLWQTADAKTPRGGYRAPTWSWAARDGYVSWDESTLQPGWTSLIEDFTISPAQECTHCYQKRRAQLELVALVAPLRDVLFASNPPDDTPWEELDDWKDLLTWDEYEELGEFILDNDGDMPLFLPDTQMVLIAGNVEAEIIQAILVQPYEDSEYFKRMGWFIHNDDKDHREFESVRLVFKSQRITLV